MPKGILLKVRAAIVAQPIGDGPEGQAESLRWKRAP